MCWKSYLIKNIRIFKFVFPSLLECMSYELIYTVNVILYVKHSKLL